MFKAIAVFGTGQMGLGIAQAAVQSGVDVLLVGRTEARSFDAHARVAGALRRLAQRGTITTAAAEEAAGRIGSLQTFGNRDEVEMAIETVSEDIAVKDVVMRNIGAWLRDDITIATNTSSLSVTRIAGAGGGVDPARVVGLHFFNPVHAMALTEISRGLRTSDRAVEDATRLSAQLGKTAIHSADAGGFVVNRVLFAMLAEACRLVEGGVASMEDVDRGMKLGTGHPMGPFALMDAIGIDVCCSIFQALQTEHGEHFRAPPMLRRRAEAGQLGRKTGQGFYRHADVRSQKVAA